MIFTEKNTDCTKTQRRSTFLNHIKFRGNDHYFEDLNSDRIETILLVHGHPFDHTMWRYQHEALGRFRLVLPDLKGYGKTGYQFEKIYIEEHALELIFLLDHLGIEKVHLIGLSMGGQIIVEFARLFPHRSKSLVICNSTPSGELESSYRNRLQLADEMLSIGMEAYTKKEIHKYLHRNINTEGVAYSHLLQMMLNTHVEGAVASHRGRAERRDNYEYLKHINIPTLLVAGDCDFFTPVTEMKNIASQMKHSKLVVVKNAGHMSNMEQPAVFNKALKDFYESM